MAMNPIICVAGLLICATGTALSWKVLYQLSGAGLNGVVHHFEKPWFTTLESALACWVSLILFSCGSWFMQSRKSGTSAEGTLSQPLLQGGDETKGLLSKEEQVSGEVDKPQRSRIGAKELLPLIFPAVCNVLSIVIQAEGLRYVSASVSQMIAGSCIIFTAILSVTILKCRLNWLHLTGIGLSFIGIMGVSLVCLLLPTRPSPSGNGLSAHIFHGHLGDAYMGNSTEGAFGHIAAGQRDLYLGSGIPSGALKNGDGASWEMALGIGLTLLSQFVLAMRLVLEEIVCGGTALHPLEVLGYEGMWGTFMMLIIGLPIAGMLPGSDPGGCEENTWDSVLMLWNSPTINGVSALFFLSVVGMNVFGLFVTLTLGSVFRAVLLTARTALVWTCNVLLYAFHVGDGAVGEPWVTPASYLQILGFATLLAGTITYAQGSSYAAAVKMTIEEVLEEEEPEQAQAHTRDESGGGAGGGTAGPTGSRVAPSKDVVLRTRSISRPPITAVAADSIMVPRTVALVDAAGTPLNAWPRLAETDPLTASHPVSGSSPSGGVAGGAGQGHRSFMMRVPGAEPKYLETLLAPSSWVNTPPVHTLQRLGEEDEESASGQVEGGMTVDDVDVPVPPVSGPRLLFPVESGVHEPPGEVPRQGKASLLFRVLSSKRQGRPGLGQLTEPEVQQPTDASACQDVEAAEEASVGPSPAMPSSQPPVDATTLPARGGLYQRFRQSFQRIVGLEHEQPSAEVLPQEGAAPARIFRPGESPVPDLLIASRVGKSKKGKNALPVFQESEEEE